MPVPSLSNIVPNDGVDPVDPGIDGLVGFTVTNASTRVIIAVEYPGLEFTELAHDGDNFMPRYAGTRVVDGADITYRLRRVPVWPDQPILRVFAFDGGDELGGN